MTLQQDADYELLTPSWHDLLLYGPSHRHRRRLIINIIKKLNITTCIDTGCAQPFLIKELEKLGLEISASDISQTVIEHNKDNHKNIDFFVWDISKEAPEKYFKKFDLSSCCEVIEHIDNYQEAVRNLCSTSSKYVLITVPSGRRYKLDESFGHFRHFTIQMLEKELNKCGFDIVYARHWGFPFFSLYRRLITFKGAKLISGEFLTPRYGYFKKAVSFILYCLFFLNLFNRGSQLFVLAKYNGGIKK